MKWISIQNTEWLNGLDDSWQKKTSWAMVSSYRIQIWFIEQCTFSCRHSDKICVNNKTTQLRQITPRRRNHSHFIACMWTGCMPHKRTKWNCWCSRISRWIIFFKKNNVKPKITFEQSQWYQNELITMNTSCRSHIYFGLLHAALSGIPVWACGITMRNEFSVKKSPKPVCN